MKITTREKSCQWDKYGYCKVHRTQDCDAVPFVKIFKKKSKEEEEDW